VVRFNSTNSTFLGFNRLVQDDFTMIIVYQSAQNNQGTGTTFYQGAGLVNGDQPNTQSDFGTGLNANGQVLAGTGNPDTSINSGSGYNNGRPHIVTFQRTESSGAIVLYVDGAQVAAGVGGTNPLTAPPTLDLGAVPSGGGFFTGDIAEVKIFSSSLSNSDRIAEENSLRCKYNLGGGAVPAIPTGLAGIAENRQVALNWAAVAGADSYDVYRSIGGGGYALLTNLVTIDMTDTSAVIGQTNYYEVTALDGCGASASSAAVGVFLPRAILSVATAGANGLNFSWPGWADDWALFYATNLASPVSWFPVTNLVGSNNGQFDLTMPIGAGTEFFRLASP